MAVACCSLLPVLTEEARCLPLNSPSFLSTVVLQLPWRLLCVEAHSMLYLNFPQRRWQPPERLEIRR